MRKHAFNDDGHGDCTECPLPATNPRHQVETLAVNEPDPVITQHQSATSQAAGEAARLRSGSLREAVYKIIANRPGGATCDEVEEILGRTHQSVSSAVHTLMHNGHITPLLDAERSDVTRMTRSGRVAQVYVAAHAAMSGAA